MVCHVMGPVSHSTRSEDILPSPSKLRLQRDWKPTVPPLSSACLQVNHADREKTSCWNNLKEKVEGNLEKKGRRGCLSKRPRQETAEDLLEVPSDVKVARMGLRVGT